MKKLKNHSIYTSQFLATSSEIGTNPIADVAESLERRKSNFEAFTNAGSANTLSKSHPIFDCHVSRSYSSPSVFLQRIGVPF